ncbi:HlyC/CorC family transporter [Methylococcus sp. Mc7]|uniref:HlyC/CorC family transporter n=1 Tax=Methylococcus sp. Mc7 TaxID=2860258 RepID=UPI001C52CA32|nr:transporter associated domain-containing protein [Methylococcus sp. Mc7]QXP83587.1 CBS domain-containing protein [Methylococcus sp. Mc7]
MSEENSGEHRSWLERLVHFLSGEPESREELLEALRHAQKRQLIETEALNMIEGVLQVSELRVRDIMIPRAQMAVVPQDAELERVFPLVVESGHSRYPVIADDRAEVVGILLVKDLLAHSLRNRRLKVSEIMRPALFVPESKRLNVLLKEFKTSRSHMAIVVDEYGGAAGLVTIEDVLEQIVGEIEDEHDLGEEEYIFRKNDQEYTLKAITPIEEFNEYFGTDFEDDEYDTVGGMIVHRLGHVPERGERIEIGPFRFTVIRADSRRVHLLRLLRLSPDALSPAAG